jgi:hypothetical protein
MTIRLIGLSSLVDRMASMTYIPRFTPNGAGSGGGPYDGRSIDSVERTIVDVRIGVTQAPREISVEMADDVDRAAVKAKVEAALSGAVDVLWLTDKKGRDIGVAAAKIAYIEVGTADSERRIGFGG